MAIEVKTAKGDLTFPDADGYTVTDGHLNIHAERERFSGIISTFAPKSWISVHEAGTYTNTTELPGVG